MAYNLDVLAHPLPNHLRVTRNNALVVNDGKVVVK